MPPFPGAPATSDDRLQIENALPGQRLRVELQKLSRGAPNPAPARARTVQVIDAGAAPPTPPGACPGSPWAHLPLPLQRQFKQDLAALTIETAVANLPPPVRDRLTAATIEPIEASPQSAAYRNKVEFSCGYQRIERIPDPRHPGSGRTMPEGFDPAVGFHPPGAWQTVRPFDDCPILPSEMIDIRRRLQAVCDLPGRVDNHRAWCDVGCRRTVMVRGGVGFSGWQVLFTLKTGGDAALQAEAGTQLLDALGHLDGLHLHLMPIETGSQARGDEPLMTLTGAAFQTVQFGALKLRLRPTSFFQTNLAAAERLAARLNSWLEPEPAAVLYDLYCGVGTLGLALAGTAERIAGLEAVPSAVTDARENARENGVTQADYTLTAAEGLPGGLWEAETAAVRRRSVAVVDPPRAGLHPKALKALCRSELGRILYVACNPAALARDLVELALAGYRLERLAPFDFFPHTPHLEQAALLRRDGAGAGTISSDSNSAARSNLPPSSGDAG
ncbi:MAG: class I SAM-dependent RNA methyltransferase [Planctomycetota bacterium]